MLQLKIYNTTYFFCNNFRLSPSDLPDHWASGTASATPTTATTASSKSNSSSRHRPSTYNNSGGNTVCHLPRSSPATATAAVTVSTTCGSLLTGPSPLLPSLAPTTPLQLNTAVGIGGAAGGSGGGGGVPGGAPGGGTSNNLLALQQQQQHQLAYHQQQLQNHPHQQPSHHLSHSKATSGSTATANIAAALQRSAANMNAVASPISANSATSTRKIRRKTDPKVNLPQSQINKCNNEKRRREMENNYIEQLSELLQLNKRGDMTSTKPDKAAILNQVVRAYRDICDKGQSRDISSTSTNNNSTTTTNNNSNKQQTTSIRCTRCATDNCSIHPVQQGEVSSTESPLPEPSMLNGQVPEISAYFEALEHYISSVGWVLLQVNANGIIESCTQNIRELIGYEKQELYHQPLYMYLYAGDHAKLEPIINNMYSGVGVSGRGASVGSAGTSWGDLDELNNGNASQQSAGSNSNSSGGGGGGAYKPKRSISTKVRMLVKDTRPATQTSNSGTLDASDQKPLRQVGQQDKYEEVVLIAAPVKDDADANSSVLCLITRPEDESPLEINMQQHVQQQPIEQMTFKLDIHGKILSLDATALREPFKQHLQTWVGRLWQDLCHPHDLSMLKSHLRDIQDSAAVHSPGSASGVPILNPPIVNVVSRPFRLRLGTPDVYVHIKANSRLFLNQTPGESDFIMSVQTLLNSENDMNTNNTGSAGAGGTGIGSICAMSPGTSLVSTLSLDALSGSNCSTSSGPATILPAHLLGGLVGGGQHNNSTTNTQTTNVGGPLMSSAIINGNASGSMGHAHVPGGVGGIPGGIQQRGMSSASASASTLVNSFTASPAGADHSFFGSDNFEFDIAHSSFDMDPTSGVSAWTDSRPNSRASVATPVSTPRPPSGHGFSPAVCASPSTPYQLSSHSAASLPSPQSNASAGGPASNYGFSFHNYDASDSKPEKEPQLNNNNNSTSSNNNNSIVSGTAGGLPDGSSGLLMTQQTPPQPELERLRHLLTKSQTHAMQGLGDDEKDLNAPKYFKQETSDDDKLGGPSLSNSNATAGLFKLSQTNAALFGISSRGAGPGILQMSANSKNPMLLSLLNERSEDDDGKGASAQGAVSNARQSELMRQLQKDDGGHSGSSSQNNSNNMSNEDLKRMLKIQSDPAMSRKRSLNEPDDDMSAKRSEDKPSKLCEKNKMLAKLLQNPPKIPKAPNPEQPLQYTSGTGQSNKRR
ncbi:nuclear receptor coactivator 2 isoform X4 [Scaptodrosophila lebanonensis]|uniref:Nuclear receptor coactivator 2 isoform X4 n=1 Tax=Drosophila lebanonensis TaxID=7225 RepID=A0A6J2TQR6_DROLE|nr:nuclear receptor coactivator 2 isoform X4 [Scaptodrosophila lebanonensis]